MRPIVLIVLYYLQAKSKNVINGDFSIILSGFLHLSIENWPSGVPKDRGFCGRGLVMGVALARFAR